MRRFKLAVDAASRGALVDLETGLPVEGVRRVRIVAEVGEPTRVEVAYLADEVLAEVEVAALVEERPAPPVTESPSQAPRSPRGTVPGRSAGGRARAAALSPERRREIARAAAAARWARLS